MENTDNKIIAKIKKAKRAALFFIEDFLNSGTSKAVSKVLERLVEKDELSLVSRGIYSRLRIDPVLGAISPTAEEINEAVRRRDKARLKCMMPMPNSLLLMKPLLPKVCAIDFKAR